jgi:hypothetical protein
MAGLGDRPARQITTREVEDLLRAVAKRGVAPRTVNKTRQLVCAIFNYGMRPSTHGLTSNPVVHADRRVEPEPSVLAFYTPQQIEALADALAQGRHRDTLVRLSQLRSRRRAVTKTAKTGRRFVSPRTRDCGAASSSPCAGATWTSTVASSS